MHKLLSILLTGSVLFTLVACQKSGDAPASQDTVRPLYLGDLDKKINEIYSKENEDMMSVCDRQWRPRILEVSRVLEEKRADIEELTKKKNSDNNIVGTDFGTFKFIDDASEPPGADDWVSYPSSWSQIIEYYEYIKDDPKNPYWVNLNRMARGMVSDDEDRIAYGSFYGLSKDSGPLVLEIKNKVFECQANAACTMPDLTTAQWNYLRDGYFYDQYYYTLRKSGGDYTKKRETLGRFAERIEGDASRYGYHKEELARVDGKTLVIPVDLSRLGEEGAQKFVALNEKAWNIDPEYSIKIIAVKDAGTPAYKIFVGNQIGGRAFVNWVSKVMQLFNWGRTKTITHEFGHILGLQDNYFTVWSTATCAYTFQSNNGDLMSNSNEGAVLPRHWEKLKAIYWPAPSAPSQPGQ